MASTSQADLTENGVKDGAGIDNPVFENPSQNNHTNKSGKNEKTIDDSAANNKRYIQKVVSYFV